MAVDTPSPEYLAMRDRWQKARDCAEGSHAIKARGPTYLPPLAGMTPNVPRQQTGGESLYRSKLTDPYWRYVERALYYNATGRTIDGLVGMVFRRPPVVEAPPGGEGLTANVDLMGRSIDAFAKTLTREVLTPGRVAVLADHTTAEASEQRPYLRIYHAEDVLNVVEGVIGGAVVPVQARLREVFSRIKEGDEFESEQVEQVRVLDLVEGIYRQRVFRRLEDGADMVQVEEVVPTIDGAPIDRIPLWMFSADEGGRPAEIEPPPLLDLMEVNLAHYRQEADYRNALHMAGVPTLVISGMEEPAAGPVKVGTEEVFFMPPPDSKAYYVSYGADGARAIRDSLDDLQQMMAYLGARMLQPDKRGIEAAETAAIHRQGEISVLAAVANGITLKLTEAFRFILRWALFGDSEDWKVELNSDFVPAQANPQLLAEIVKGWQAGVFSHDSVWHFAQMGELVDPRRTVEDEVELISKEEAKRPKPVLITPGLQDGQEQEEEPPAEELPVAAE